MVIAEIKLKDKYRDNDIEIKEMELSNELLDYVVDHILSESGNNNNVRRRNRVKYKFSREFKAMLISENVDGSEQKSNEKSYFVGIQFKENTIASLFEDDDCYEDDDDIYYCGVKADGIVKNKKTVSKVN